MIAVVAVATLLAGAGPASSGQSDDLERARRERAAVQSDLDVIVAELDRLSVRITDAEQQQERLEADVAALEQTAGRARRLLAARARKAFVDPPANAIEVLLASDGPQQALARARLLDGMGRHEREVIERAQAARAGLDSKRAQLEALLADLRSDRERVALLRERLDEQFRLARAREQELESRRARQRQVSRRGQRGTYACPLQPPFHFRDTWGAPRSGGRRHKGVDLFAPMGAQVYAITNGTVVRHSRNRLGGVGLYLAGADGNQYYYAHLQRILPGYGPGRRVVAGELIALNGASGNASANAPHIHLEVRPGGGRQTNPYPFAAAVCY